MSKWTKSTSDTEPSQDGRYAIIYQQGPHVRRFVGDYSVRDGWLGTFGADVIGWAELPDIPDWVIQKYSKSTPQQA